MMTIDDAIKILLEEADKQDKLSQMAKRFEDQEWYKNLIEFYTDNAFNYRQMAEWLTEYKEAKQLLKNANDGFDKLVETVIPFNHIVCDYAMQFANPYDACSACPLSNGRYKICKWSCADEALKLIGGRDNASS